MSLASLHGGNPNTVSTIERRLVSINWNCAQRGMPQDRQNRAIATVIAVPLCDWTRRS
jgi:hypothetical protein